MRREMQGAADAVRHAADARAAAATRVACISEHGDGLGTRTARMGEESAAGPLVTAVGEATVPAMGSYPYTPAPGEAPRISLGGA
jgi:hypothetical protein